MPMGMKATPMMKKVGRTVPAVKMGCHAGKRCCLKALSASVTIKTNEKKVQKVLGISYDLLDGFLVVVDEVCALTEGSAMSLGSGAELRSHQMCVADSLFVDTKSLLYVRERLWPFRFLSLSLLLSYRCNTSDPYIAHMSDK